MQTHTAIWVVTIAMLVVCLGLGCAPLPLPVDQAALSMPLWGSQ